MPLTTLAVTAIGWAAEQAGSALAGRGVAAGAGALKPRLRELSGQPASDLARGLRLAQGRALERVVRDYDEVGEKPPLAGLAPDTFVERALACCRDGGALALRWHGNDLTDVGVVHDPATGAAMVEEAVLDALGRALNGAVIPPAFARHFREGGRGRKPYRDLFVDCFVEQARQDAGFRDVLQPLLLVNLTVSARATEDSLAGLERGQAEILRLVMAEKGVPAAPLLTILERLGETGVPPEEIPTRLSAKADEYLKLREQWIAMGGDMSDVAAVRQAALALIDMGDLAGARRLFVDARSAIRTARQQRAREEAALLKGEAQIDRLELQYRAAADRYQEAETLVASFDTDLHFELLRLRAEVVQVLGVEYGDNQALKEAVDLWDTAVGCRPRFTAPLEWAGMQNNLGTALTTLGERESGTERLEEAVRAYLSALQEWTRQRLPLDWAMTQNNLGNALARLGERESGTQRLEEAVEAYRSALVEWTRERVPLDWARTQNNLGNALRTLGARKRETERLEEAVKAYLSALEERTRELVPLDWAMTQNNLGVALTTLGERESGTERLEEAVGACRSALEEWTRERVPQYWATTQNNLGIALRTLGLQQA